MKLLMHFISGLILSLKKRNGTEHSWPGDGGIFYFLQEKAEDKAVDNAVLASMDIFKELTNFNESQNKLYLKGERTDIRIRLGLDFGRATYHQDSGNWHDEPLITAVKIQKKASPNTGYITPTAYNNLSDNLKIDLDQQNSSLKVFTKEGLYKKLIGYIRRSLKDKTKTKKGKVSIIAGVVLFLAPALHFLIQFIREHFAKIKKFIIWIIEVILHFIIPSIISLLPKLQDFFYEHRRVIFGVSCAMSIVGFILWLKSRKSPDKGVQRIKRISVTVITFGILLIMIGSIQWYTTPPTPSTPVTPPPTSVTPSPSTPVTPPPTSVTPSPSTPVTPPSTPVTPPPTSVTPVNPEVPPLVDITKEEAKATLERKGLQCSIIEEYSDKPQYTVIGQTPWAGKSVTPGSTVTLTIAKWPVVPNVIKKPLGEAKEEITANNLFKVGNIEPREAQNNWVVSKQKPEGDNKAPQGAEVNLWAKVCVTFVLGLPIGEAIKELEKNGLNGTITGEIESVQYLQGTIARQEPEPKSLVEKGTTIKLWISTSTAGEVYRDAIEKKQEGNRQEAINLFGRCNFEQYFSLNFKE